MATTNNTMDKYDNYLIINLNNHILYRGIPINQKDAYKPEIPQWFSHDPNHDYILLPGNKRVEFKVTADCNVINLQNKVIQNILNIAIDRIPNQTLLDLVKKLNIPYEKKDVQILQEYFIEENDSAKMPILKTKLKSVYGGVPMSEQISVMNAPIFKDRLQRVNNLAGMLKSEYTHSSFRYSLYKYDKLLMYLIGKYFKQNFLFFEKNKICGWWHGNWFTPWHDKYRNGTQQFITEVAVILPGVNVLSENGTSNPPSTSSIYGWVHDDMMEDDMMEIDEGAATISGGKIISKNVSQTKKKLRKKSQKKKSTNVGSL